MNKREQYEDKLTGVIERIIYYNEENGYAVLRIKPQDIPREIVVTGLLPGINIGEKLHLKGNWIIHPEYGQQFQALSYQVEQPADAEGITRLLSSSLIKGIGPKTAEKIVSTFGTESLDVIDREPERLEEIEGIGRSKRKLIEKGWQEKREIKNIMLFLQKYGITTNLAVKIYKTYGERAFQILKTNPYRLSDDIYGVGFKTADNIARSFGLRKDSRERIKAGLFYLILQFAEEGHCYARREELLKRSEELLITGRKKIEPVLEQLIDSGELIAEEDAIYHPVYYHTERKVAQRVLSIQNCQATQLSALKSVDWDVVFQWLHDRSQIPFSVQQKSAIKACLTNKITVLTGGPGTGKSTITKALATVLQAKHFKLILTAPTGRAAKRLTEVTGLQAKTIHRLLEFSWQDGLSFHRNENNPLDAAMLIIDEASMLDINILNHLLKAVRSDISIVFIGDVDQLPSVGAGYVLHDLIVSGVIPVVRLHQIFRQESNSSIITNAHRIRKGEHPIFSRHDGDFYLFPAESPQRATDTIVQLVTEKIPETFSFEPLRDIQVLAPMHKGESGISELNRRLQAALNPGHGEENELLLAGKIFRTGDRVIQLNNNYEKDVFNGDLGIIKAIDRELQTVRVSFEEKIAEYEFSELDQLNHSYAITIHKSQGSEFPVIVIPLLMQHYIMLQRNLLYTGITRAKKLVVIVGNLQALDIALGNNRTTRRNSMLTQLLREKKFNLSV